MTGMFGLGIGARQTVDFSLLPEGEGYGWMTDGGPAGAEDGTDAASPEGEGYNWMTDRVPARSIAQVFGESGVWVEASGPFNFPHIMAKIGDNCLREGDAFGMSILRNALGLYHPLLEGYFWAEALLGIHFVRGLLELDDHPEETRRN